MASTRLRPREAVTARLAALDLAALRFARTFAHTPEAERAVRSYSQLGQHAACWLALGTAGVGF
jgi:hypothetical protein